MARVKHIPKVRCVACGGRIAVDQGVIQNYHYYHENCLDSIKKENRETKEKRK